jgi:hypothetical protein
VSCSGRGNSLANARTSDQGGRQTSVRVAMSFHVGLPLLLNQAQPLPDPLHTMPQLAQPGVHFQAQFGDLAWFPPLVCSSVFTSPCISTRSASILASVLPLRTDTVTATTISVPTRVRMGGSLICTFGSFTVRPRRDHGPPRASHFSTHAEMSVAGIWSDYPLSSSSVARNLKALMMVPRSSDVRCYKALRLVRGFVLIEVVGED